MKEQEGSITLSFKPGDLIFIRESNLAAWLIRYWTRRGAPSWEPDGFNHVAICIKGAKWLSAEPSGIKMVSITELIKRARCFYIMRYEGEQAEKASEVADIALKLAAGRPYDFLGIIGFVMHRLLNIKVDWGNKWFCSELCTQAYIEFFAKYGVCFENRDPADTTPNDMANWALRNGFRIVSVVEMLKH